MSFDECEIVRNEGLCAVFVMVPSTLLLFIVPYASCAEDGKPLRGVELSELYAAPQIVRIF